MKKVPLIFITSILCACIGCAVAYYNTASLGYDNANLISFYDGGVYIFDFDINYNKSKAVIEKIKHYIPEEFIPI